MGCIPFYHECCGVGNSLHHWGSQGTKVSGSNSELLSACGNTENLNSRLYICKTCISIHYYSSRSQKTFFETKEIVQRLHSFDPLDSWYHIRSPELFQEWSLIRVRSTSLTLEGIVQGIPSKILLMSSFPTKPKVCIFKGIEPFALVYFLWSHTQWCLGAKPGMVTSLAWFSGVTPNKQCSLGSMKCRRWKPRLPLKNMCFSSLEYLLGPMKDIKSSVAVKNQLNRTPNPAQL